MIAKVDGTNGDTNSIRLPVVERSRGHDCKLVVAAEKTNEAPVEPTPRSMRTATTRLLVELNQLAPSDRRTCSQKQRRTRACWTEVHSFSNAPAHVGQCLSTRAAVPEWCWTARSAPTPGRSAARA